MLEKLIHLSVNAFFEISPVNNLIRPPVLAAIHVVISFPSFVKAPFWHGRLIILTILFHKCITSIYVVTNYKRQNWQRNCLYFTILTIILFIDARSGLNIDLVKKNEDCFTCREGAGLSSWCRKTYYISWLQDFKYLARRGLSSILIWKLNFCSQLFARNWDL